MNKGGTIDFEWVKVIMVSADHSGGCPGENCIIPGGAAAGFVFKFNGRTLYHAGDTNVFGDMKLITDMYKPDTALLPIGGHFTMGPYEAAYALTKLLTTVCVCYPMHFKTFEILKGDVPELRAQMKKLGQSKTVVVDSYKHIGKETKISPWDL